VNVAEKMCVVLRLVIGTWKLEWSFPNGCSRGAVCSSSFGDWYLETGGELLKGM
jgi:hypothetical protein